MLIALGASALTAPFPSFAQAQKVHRIGILFGSSQFFPPLLAFLEELKRLGYVDGRNVAIVSRIAEGKLDRLPAFATELVAEKVDVIFAHSTIAVEAAQKATTSIPIVFSVVSDPVESGFVDSLARPGRNITGTSNLVRELAAKRLQILKELAPRASRIALLVTDDQSVAPQMVEIREAAKSLNMNTFTEQILTPSDFAEASKRLRSQHANSICVVESTKNAFNRKTLAEFAAQARLPAMYPHSQYADAGGLASYGPNYAELYRRAAHYVDKILKGAKPADLPVELPTHFELVINMKTAKALAIKIPPSLLARADRVIE